MQNDFNYREPVQKILQDLHISMDFCQLKSGPGITRSDLLVINKIALAPYVGADLSVMKRDTKRMREARPFVFTNLKDGTGFTAVVDWLRGHL